MFSNISSNLIWVDLEMSGLDIKKDKILEISVIVTDRYLNVISECVDFIIYQPIHILNNMDDWNTINHKKSGLFNLVLKSKNDEKVVEKKILYFLSNFTIKKSSPICGNSLFLDRIFLEFYMPNLFCYFHYRSLDVSSFKILFSKLFPLTFDEDFFIKKSLHRSKYDVIESINELRFYCKKYFLF